MWLIIVVIFIAVVLASQVNSLVEVLRGGDADAKQQASKSLLLTSEVVSTFALLCLSVFTDEVFIFFLVGAFIIFNISILNFKPFLDVEYYIRYKNISRISLFRLIFSIVSLIVTIASSWLLGNGYKFAGNFLNLLLYILFALFYLITSFVSLFMIESFKRWLVEGLQLKRIKNAEINEV